MTTNAEKIYSIVKPIIGLKAWEAEKGYATSVFIHFGEISKTRFGHIVGERQLWLQHTWRIEAKKEVIATSNARDKDPKYLEALSIIDGKQLAKVNILEPSLDTTFIFESDIRIFVYNSYLEGPTDLAAWKFIYPKGTLSVGPGSGFSVFSDTEK